MRQKGPTRARQTHRNVYWVGVCRAAVATRVTWMLLTVALAATRDDDLPRRRCLPCRGGLGDVAPFISLGLISGRPFSPFRRAISASCSATRFNSANSPSSRSARAFSSDPDRTSSQCNDRRYEGNRPPDGLRAHSDSLPPVP